MQSRYGLHCGYTKVTRLVPSPAMCHHLRVPPFREVQSQHFSMHPHLPLHFLDVVVGSPELVLLFDLQVW